MTYNVSQQGKFLYRMHGEEFTVDAHIIAIDGAKIQIEYIIPANKWSMAKGFSGSHTAHRWLRSQQERSRFMTDTSVDIKRAYPDMRMGRPSQGRERRLQFSATSEMEAYLEARRIQEGKKSISEVVFEIVHQVMEQK